jgi:hypothetical protein
MLVSPLKADAIPAGEVLPMEILTADRPVRPDENGLDRL